MQTVSVQIEDSYMQQFMNFVKNSKSKVRVKSEEKYNLDPHYDMRKKELHKIRADIKSGTMEMLNEEQYEQEIEQFFESIEK